MNSESFYLRNEYSTNLKGERLVRENVLYFKMNRAALGKTTAPDIEFDNRATADHVKWYPQAYAEFKVKNPDFVLPWPDVQIGEIRGDVVEK